MLRQITAILMHKLSQIQELEKFLENILPYSCMFIGWLLGHLYRIASTLRFEPGASLRNLLSSRTRGLKESPGWLEWEARAFIFMGKWEIMG